MSSIRLPQNRAEIEAAAAELVWTARNDAWSTDFGGSEMGPSRLIRTQDMPTDTKIEQWLEQHSRMGAIEGRRLVDMIELSLLPWSPDVRKLGAKRVVTILGRSRWRGAIHFKPSGAC